MASNAPFSSLPLSLTESNFDTLPQFVHLDERHKCLVCKGLLRNACQTSCGHRVCESCVDTIFASGEPAPCPGGEDDCEEQTRQNINPDQSCRRELHKIPVYCLNQPAGCKETMPWKNLQSHLAKCQFQTEECPNKQRGCQLRLLKSTLKKHVESECQYRLIKCQLCKEDVTAFQLQEHHDRDCPEQIIKCPYGCGAAEMKRREFERHRDTCPKKPEECKFKRMGCTFEGSKEEIEKHEVENLSKHLDLITVRTAQLELQNSQLQGELQTVTRQRNELAESVNNQTLENERLKAGIAKLETETRELKLKMVSHLERIIRMEQTMTSLPNAQQMEQWRQEMEQLKQTVQTLQARPVGGVVGGVGNVGSGDAITRYGDLNTMADALTTQLSAHDRQIGIHDVRLAEMDLRFQILETASYDGTLLWKIRDYQRRKQDAVNGRTLSLYSQPFYTGRYGYKMCARVYLNGDGMGKTTHVSLFFVVMKGEYDSLLPWPFQQKVTLYLLDQGPEKRHLSDHFFPDASSTSFRKPTSEMNIASGCPLFVSHSVLENATSSYLKEDTIFIKVVVDNTNLRHP